MVSQKQLDILQQGAKVWNVWRTQYRETPINLSRANLSGIDLSEVDLSGADLSSAILTNTDLSGANLSGADLSATKLIEMDRRGGAISGANLNGANLNGANLRRADLSNTYLKEANFSGADLTLTNFSSAKIINTNFTGANLSRADLTSARFSNVNLTNVEVVSTTFGDLDLSTAKGLETIRHSGFSTIGIDTIYRSQGKIPEIFLRKAGVPQSFLEVMTAITNRPIEYYTCFISYSSKDEKFVQRLYTDLQQTGVRCWYAPEDLKTGDLFWKRIDESIRVYDKLLVILSSHSVESDWVEREVMAALEKEGQQKRHVLFPLHLDHAVKITSTPWAADMRRRRHMTDFTGWETDYTMYQRGLERLLRDLKAESAK